MSLGRPELPLPSVMLVTDRRMCGDRRLEDVVQAAVEGGVNVVQVREKDLPSGELYELVLRVIGVARPRAVVMVNDRIDVALAAGADGVQLGMSAMPLEAARRIAGHLMIGRSVHDVSCAAEAGARGADLLLVGTIFASASHPGIQPAGPSLIRKIAATTSVPIIGIGGITAGNVGQVIAAGASGVAVIGEVWRALDPRAAASKLVAAANEAWPTAPLHRRH